MCSCARIGAAGRDAADQRQAQLRQAGQRQAVLLAVLAQARGVERAQCVRLQADAARGAAHQFDDALARQRLQVLFGGVGRAKAQFGGDLGAGGRGAGALDGALHQVEDLLLAVGELGAFDHGVRLLICPVTVFSSMIRHTMASIDGTVRDPGHRRHHCRHRRERDRQRRLPGGAAGRARPWWRRCRRWPAGRSNASRSPRSTART